MVEAHFLFRDLVIQNWPLRSEIFVQNPFQLKKKKKNRCLPESQLSFFLVSANVMNSEEVGIRNAEELFPFDNLGVTSTGVIWFKFLAEIESKNGENGTRFVGL